MTAVQRLEPDPNPVPQLLRVGHRQTGLAVAAVLDLASRDLADVVADDDGLPVDEVRFGQPEHSEFDGDRRVGIVGSGVRVASTEFIEEGNSPRLILMEDADKPHAQVPVGGCRCQQCRMLLSTREHHDAQKSTIVMPPRVSARRN